MRTAESIRSEFQKDESNYYEQQFQRNTIFWQVADNLPSGTADAKATKYYIAADTNMFPLYAPTSDISQQSIVAAFCSLDKHQIPWTDAKVESTIYTDPDAMAFAIRRVTSTAKNLKTEFKRLVAIWKRETGFLSRIDQKMTHPAYKQIIAMGAAAIPLILDDLETNGGHWVDALSELTQHEPIPPDENYALSDLVAAWIACGKRHYPKARPKV
jgi:hypothetical protein